MKKNIDTDRLIYMTLFFFASISIGYGQKILTTQQQDRWSIQPDGSILWKTTDRLPHADHIEMSGEQVSVWVQYKITGTKKAEISRTVVFPTFRLSPNETHSSLMYTFRDCDLPRFFINGQPLRADIINGAHLTDLPQVTDSIRQKGIMRVYSTIGESGNVKLVRSLFPSVDKPMSIEKFVFSNIGEKEISVSMEYLKREIHTIDEISISKSHNIILGTVNDGQRPLQPGESVSFGVYYMASRGRDLSLNIDIGKEESARQNRVEQIIGKLQLETPDPVLNTAFNFAKIRATESIFKTKGGYMHSPGGLTYYSAIWANDQAEYINPFFAFLGDSIGNKSAMNAYRHFALFMNPGFKPIPSSIVAEGDSYWNGVGDRGDMAMIAYGASRYALAFGNADTAKALWPLIKWCLEYSSRKLNSNGVVTSDSDELEGRFPSGKANLSTNVLYYDALLSAAWLGKEIGEPKSVTTRYHKSAKQLRINMEKYFGGVVEGFKTYKYYEGNDVLRSWICLPLTAGILERREGTINALFSPRLWTQDGLATRAGDKTFWDRSTLYALRGVLIAGETDRAMNYLRYYSRRRLLGEHVPYPVEAFPEGNQKHLSAESGLYCRIYTEGLFGIRPAGLNSFFCTPRLPKEWNFMALRNIHAFGDVFDLEISRTDKGKLSVIIKNNSEQKTFIIDEGSTQRVKL